MYQEAVEYFVCGYSYGVTNVIVGQPFDTIKTRMQTMPDSSVTQFVKQEGIRGLYRGGTSLVLGGALMRSAQFGIYGSTLTYLKSRSGSSDTRIAGMLDYNVLLAGFVGGAGRGLVEGPFEYVKVRRQVDKPWKVREIFKGSGATVFRNSFLFSSFVIYIDLSKQLIPGGLSPFWLGSICSCMAWLTIWPLDVAKSQLQSGNYQGKSYAYLLWDVFRTGKVLQGIVPGLVRSSIANGCSMVVYKKVEDWFADNRGSTADSKQRL
jgi:solute carrier family 25 carnitine/acylcarnitine transporter 20/29